LNLEILLIFVGCGYYHNIAWLNDIKSNILLIHEPI